MQVFSFDSSRGSVAQPWDTLSLTDTAGDFFFYFRRKTEKNDLKLPTDNLKILHYNLSTHNPMKVIPVRWVSHLKIFGSVYTWPFPVVFVIWWHKREANRRRAVQSRRLSGVIMKLQTEHENILFPYFIYLYFSNSVATCIRVFPSLPTRSTVEGLSLLPGADGDNSSASLVVT